MLPERDGDLEMRRLREEILELKERISDYTREKEKVDWMFERQQQVTDSVANSQMPKVTRLQNVSSR